MYFWQLSESGPSCLGFRSAAAVDQHLKEDGVVQCMSYTINYVSTGQSDIESEATMENSLNLRSFSLLLDYREWKSDALQFDIEKGWTFVTDVNISMFGTPKSPTTLHAMNDGFYAIGLLDGSVNIRQLFDTDGFVLRGRPNAKRCLFLAFESHGPMREQGICVFDSIAGWFGEALVSALGYEKKIRIRVGVNTATQTVELIHAPCAIDSVFLMTDSPCLVCGANAELLVYDLRARHWTHRLTIPVVSKAAVGDSSRPLTQSTLSFSTSHGERRVFVNSRFHERDFDCNFDRQHLY